uniref:Jacalin-type lectin domain-containing protein n=1 Tax=Phytophthora ramorum TaxID=164328 RepID=H3GR61_PHYRM
MSSDSTDLDTEDNEASFSSRTAPPVAFGAHVTTIDTVESIHRNWVGPTIGAPDGGDSACYRKAHIMKTCPVGFDYKWKTCWAQCPLSYPVKCGLECIRQNDDCGLEYYSKTSNVVQAAISLTTMGLFGQLTAAAKKLVPGAKCIRAIIGNMKMLIKYISYIKVYDPQAPFDRVMAVLYQTSYVTIDFPVIIAMCLGLPYPAVMDPASWIVDSIQLQLGELLDHGANIIRGWDRFTAFLKRTNFTQPLEELNENEISSLKTGLASNSTCGYELKRLTDHTWMTVAQMKREKPGITQNELRVAMYESDLFVRDIPTVTNNCMEHFISESSEATAYETRDTLRKTLGVITDDLIKSGTSDNGTSLTAKQYVRVVTDKVAMTAFVLGIDNTGILGVITEYIQPICGPTQFIGEIDDGTDPNTLGLNIVGEAFSDSSLVWKRQGDGVVTITFQSADTKNVTVNIFSGGDKVDEMFVRAGGAATWSSNVTALGGRSLYLDRWRPGFLGLPGTGGGSLKLWVPRADEGGHLDLAVKLNVS